MTFLVPDTLTSVTSTVGRDVHSCQFPLAMPCQAPCGQPLVPTGTQSLTRIFSNHSVLAGAPLRNRTVDLLLTMETLCRLS